MSETIHVNPSRMTLHLDIVMYQRDDLWVGHCAQLDVLTSGPDRDKVFAGAQKICLAQVFNALATGKIGQLFRPPNPELLAVMLQARSEGMLTLAMRDHDADNLVQFQRLIAAQSPAQKAA